LKYCDSLMVTRGVQRTSVSATTDTPMVLRVSGGSSIIGDDLSQEDITVSLEEAIRLNASALQCLFLLAQNMNIKLLLIWEN